MEVLCITPACKEKQNPSILHSSCSIPVVKGVPYHPYKGAGALINFAKTVPRAGVIALVGMRETESLPSSFLVYIKDDGVRYMIVKIGLNTRKTN